MKKLICSILTIFTSNDTVILTLTPIIAYFTDYTKIDPFPYLFGQVLFSIIIKTIMLVFCM